MCSWICIWGLVQLLFGVIFRYLDIYEKYTGLIDLSAKEQISAFLQGTHSLEEFTAVFHLLTSNFFLTWNAFLTHSLCLSLRTLNHLMWCVRRLLCYTPPCLCPCFAWMPASWIMTCVTARWAWETRWSRSKWMRTERWIKGNKVPAPNSNIWFTCLNHWMPDKCLSFPASVSNTRILPQPSEASRKIQSNW